jgi:hypothetical protein
MSRDMGVMVPDPGWQPTPVLTPWLPVMPANGEASLSAVQAHPVGDTTTRPPAATNNMGTQCFTQVYCCMAVADISRGCMALLLLGHDDSNNGTETVHHLADPSRWAELASDSFPEASKPHAILGAGNTWWTCTYQQTVQQLTEFSEIVPVLLPAYSEA